MGIAYYEIHKNYQSSEKNKSVLQKCIDDVKCHEEKLKVINDNLDSSK